MQLEQLFLPALATAALGTAMLVPLREERKRVRDWGTFAKSARRWFQTDVQTPQTESLDTQAPSDVVTERSFAETLETLLSVHDDLGDTIDPVDSACASPVDEYAVRPAARLKLERAVPLTRMPLRHRDETIGWPAALAGRTFASRADRHNFLTIDSIEPIAGLCAILIAAYHEEDAEGRMLALRAMRRGRFESARAAFVDALAVGTDDERALAVDALLEGGWRSDVTPAFSDRIDAIAARAALGYVGEAPRSGYVSALAPFVDRPRIDAILALLGGVVE